MFSTAGIQIRFTQGIAVVAAAAAVFAPAASATNPITDTLAPGGTSTNSPHFITDTLAPGGSSVPAGGYRFVTDTLAPGGGASGAVSVLAGDGFSWVDAGIGAVVPTALMLVALMGRRLAHRRRGQLSY